MSASVDMIARGPSTESVIWTGHAADADAVDAAIDRAAGAAGMWSMQRLDTRIQIVRKFEEQLKARRQALIDIIATSTGKPLWESATEVDAMIGKVGLSIEAYEQRCAERVRDLPGGVSGVTRYRPHGVCVVLGPFNFPGHLPNGHIVPALLAGNVVVFKPSELTPAVADLYQSLWLAAGLPVDVLQVVHGGRATGEALTVHEDVAGIFFTGSHAAGVAIARANVDRPGVILALEMGGNNPLITWRVADPQAAATHIVQSAFASAGQRCSCARRLILQRGDAATLDAVVALTRRIRVGAPNDSPEPFCGPLISAAARASARAFESRLIAVGGRSIVPFAAPDRAGFFLRPAIVDCSSIADVDITGFDDECFAPLLQVQFVEHFDEAVIEANATRFGLSAGLLSDDPQLWQQFERHIRAGVITWNRPTTGASSALPFGGVGDSGNHRPSAFLAADYCAYPMAVMRSDTLTAAKLVGVNDA